MSRQGTANLVIALQVCLGLHGCTTTPRITYKKDVRPILAAKCSACHIPPYGEGYRMTGLDMTSYETLMAGSIYGPVVIPHSSQKSPLNMLIEGRAGDLTRVLALRHQSMTDNEIRLLRLWVDQGARNQ